MNISQQVGIHTDIREFKIYDATVAKRRSKWQVQACRSSPSLCQFV